MAKITLGAVNPIPGSSRNYHTGSWRSMKPIMDKECCIKCWICYNFCPESSVIKTEDGPEIDYDYCKGCGICAEECPKNCIKMIEEEK